MGWQHKDWIGPFLPEGTKLPTCCANTRALSTVEVDSTFYGRPRESTVDAWNADVPDGFQFALKVPREVTHRRRFRDLENVFTLFLERVRKLGPKLGAILLQCPPDFKPTPGNRDRLFTFLASSLPSDIRVALELRGDDDALFAYLRWMGPMAFEHYDRVQADKSATLDAWTAIIDELRPHVDDIFGYVSDDYAGHAPATVRDLLHRLGESAPPELTTLRLF